MEGANLDILPISIWWSSRPFHNLGECPPPLPFQQKSRGWMYLWYPFTCRGQLSNLFVPVLGVPWTRYHEHHEQWKPKNMHITCTVFRVFFFNVDSGVKFCLTHTEFMLQRKSLESRKGSIFGFARKVIGKLSHRFVKIDPDWRCISYRKWCYSSQMF